jgi:predicted TIM-barrel fold metal-dependent hydrolase
MLETSGSDPASHQTAHRSPDAGWIDSHAHVFERGLPLARQRRYAPAYDAPLDAYLAQLDAHGISRGVLVQPSFLGTDCTYLLAALRRAPARLRGVAVTDAACNAEDLAAMSRAGVVGIRLNLIGLPDAPLEQRVTPETLALIHELGWHVEIHAEAARLEPIVAPLLERGLNVVIDHFGRPDPALGLRDEGFRRLVEMGKTQQVWVKVSAAYRNWHLESGEHVAHEAVQRLKETFTVARMMWGSDWPHTQFETSQSFGPMLDLARRLLPDEADRHAVFSTTPASFYRFDEAFICG